MYYFHCYFTNWYLQYPTFTNVLLFFYITDPHATIVIFALSKHFWNWTQLPFQEEIKSNLKALQDKLDSFQRTKQACDLHIQHIQVKNISILKTMPLIILGN